MLVTVCLVMLITMHLDKMAYQHLLVLQDKVCLCITIFEFLEVPHGFVLSATLFLCLKRLHTVCNSTLITTSVILY